MYNYRDNGHLFIKIPFLKIMVIFLVYILPTNFHFYYLKQVVKTSSCFIHQ